MTVLRSGSASDVGRMRPINQDMALEEPNLYAVADGMGGHVGGEVAARVAVETLGLAFERSPTVEGLREAFAEANTAVWHESQSNIDLRGMGTTLTAVALVGGPDGRDVLALANVGDSRAYVYSDGELLQVTDDHSLAEERMRHGEMTEAEAAIHPQRHILTRVIGVFSEVEADMWELELHTGDRVLLCSDGLSNEVDTDEMAAILGSVDDPEEAAHRLVDAANEHGGADNITVVIVDVQVGEEGAAGVARVRPLDLRSSSVTLPAATAGAAAASNGAAETLSPDAAEGGGPGPDSGEASDAALQTAAIPAVRPDDTLAPGARLAFGDEPRALAETGPSSDEFFLGTTAAVPVARATTRVPPPPPPRTGADRAPEKESRGARRRRLGIPRRITPRVVGFILLVAAVPVAAYFVLKWYAYDNWIVTVQGDQIVVKQGQPGGVLWFHPKLVDRTPYTTSDIVPAAIAPVRSGVQKPSLDDAKRYVTTITTSITTTTTTTATTTTTRPFRQQVVVPSPTTTTTVPLTQTTATTATSVP